MKPVVMEKNKHIKGKKYYLFFCCLLVLKSSVSFKKQYKYCIFIIDWFHSFFNYKTTDAIIIYLPDVQAFKTLFFTFLFLARRPRMFLKHVVLYNSGFKSLRLFNLPTLLGMLLLVVIARFRCYLFSHVRFSFQIFRVLEDLWALEDFLACQDHQASLVQKDP